MNDLENFVFNNESVDSTVPYKHSLRSRNKDTWSLLESTFPLDDNFYNSRFFKTQLNKDMSTLNDIKSSSLPEVWKEFLKVLKSNEYKSTLIEYLGRGKLDDFRLEIKFQTSILETENSLITHIDTSRKTVSEIFFFNKAVEGGDHILYTPIVEDIKKKVAYKNNLTEPLNGLVINKDETIKYLNEVKRININGPVSLIFKNDEHSWHSVDKSSLNEVRKSLNVRLIDTRIEKLQKNYKG